MIVGEIVLRWVDVNVKDGDNVEDLVQVQLFGVSDLDGVGVLVGTYVLIHIYNQMRFISQREIVGVGVNILFR